MTMQTFCLISSDPTYIQKTIQTVRELHRISDWNFQEIIPESSFGIDLVRKLQSTLAVKPMAGENRLVVLRDFHKATPESQNAMLKTLEEPPLSTYIMLVAATKEKLLPTVVSRCEVITDTTHAIADKKYESLIVEILHASPGRRIQLAQEYAKSKEDALTALTQMSLALHHIVHHSHEGQKLSTLLAVSTLSKISSARQYIEGNINVKITMDILFLGFPKI